jgi:hypothetical protein
MHLFKNHDFNIYAYQNISDQYFYYLNFSLNILLKINFDRKKTPSSYDHGILYTVEQVNP